MCVHVFSWFVMLHCNFVDALSRSFSSSHTQSSKSGDLFSYGTVLWELVTHEAPFVELNDAPFPIKCTIVKGKVRSLFQSHWFGSRN